MKSKLILIACIFAICSCLLAKYSDAFFIGDYSNLYDENYWNYAKEAGFNVVKIKANPNEHESITTNKISLIDSKGFDVFLWDNANNTNSIYKNSFSNKYKYQAEYTKLADDYINPQTLRDQYDWFYSFNYDPALLSNNTIEVFNNEIKCNVLAGASGYNVFTDLKIRENMPELDPTTASSDSLLLVQLLYEDDRNTEFYVTFRMKSNNASNDPICKIGLKIAVDNTDSQNNYITYNYDISSLLVSTNPTSYDGLVLNKDCFQNSQGPTSQGWSTFVYKLTIAQINDYIILHPPTENPNYTGPFKMSYGADRIYYIAPTLYFCNNGDLSVDYVEFEDNYHKDFSSRKDAVLARMNTFYGNNLLGFDTFDESSQPQFDIFRQLKTIPNSHPNMELQTAVTTFGWDNTQEYDNNKYSMMKHYSIETQSNTLCPDAYLAGNQKALYNSASLTNPDHIQNLTDTITRNYRMTKNVSLSSNPPKQFIPAIQAYGLWDKDNNGNWKWKNIMLPPNAQQKMLMYLPLCYGVDGLWEFKFASDVDLSDIGTEDWDDREPIISPINYRGTNLEITFPEQYQVIKEANNRILSIGNIIKNLQWISGNTIIDNSALTTNSSSVPVINATISNPYDANQQSISPAYHGFVEYGIYKDDIDQVYLMLVNRRTNKKDLPENQEINTFNVNSSFTTAPPQEVTLNVGNIPNDWMAYNCLTGENYSICNGIVTVPIDAGDGLLVKVGYRAVPPVIKANEVFLLSDEKVYYDIINRGKLRITNNVEFINSKIINEPNAELTINNATITSNSNTDMINYSNHNIINISNSTLSATKDILAPLSRFENSNNTIKLTNSNFIGNNKTNKAIIYHTYNNGMSLYISGCSFNNFDKGIQYFTSSNSTDKIIDNNFSNNNTGLYIFGEGHLSPISNCTFVDNMLGLESIFTNTKIKDCTFSRVNLGSTTYSPLGIRLENNYVFPRASSDPIIPDSVMIWQVRNCSFNDLKIGVEIYGASTRFINNEFNCKTNMKLLDRSFPDLSFRACNNFYSNNPTVAHFFMTDESSIKLKSGHNDIFNPDLIPNSDPYYNKHDFFINRNNLIINRNLPSVIDCSQNYWDTPINGVSVDINDTTFASNFIIDNLDPTENDNSPFDINSQIDQARVDLKDCNFDQALIIFKGIMVNQIENEKEYWKECVDECFNITGYIKGDFKQLIDTYQSLYDNPPIYLSQTEKNDYLSLLEDFIKRCYMQIDAKSSTNIEFAKQILINRIQNPDSEIDQLCAGINLDNILLLETINDSQNKSSSNYEESSLIINSIDASKNTKFNQLNMLFNEKDESTNPIIPKKIEAVNYPNPFNPSTTIQFGLPVDSDVKINIYNIKGQKIKALVSQKMIAGTHKVEWNGKDQMNKSVSSGIYFYQIKTNKGSINKKMLMLK